MEKTKLSKHTLKYEWKKEGKKEKRTKKEKKRKKKTKERKKCKCKQTPLPTDTYTLGPSNYLTFNLGTSTSNVGIL